MIRVSSRLALDDRDLEFQFIRASGPGGQNVNKLSTAVQLRYDTARLPADTRARLQSLAGRRLNREGVLVIEAQRFRTRERNRQDAVDRLVALLRRAEQKPKPRKKTRPGPAAKKRRLEAKQKRGRTKHLRGKPSLD